MKKDKLILVCGSSIDGKISPGRNISSKEFGPYLTKKLGLELHKLRSKVDGIIVTINTVIQDNPNLTVRGIKTKKIPIRIIIDRLGKKQNLDSSRF